MLFGILKTAIEVVITFVTCGATGTLYVLLLGLVIFALSGSVSVDQLALAADPPNVKLLDKKEATRNDPFAAIHDKPSSENPTLIPQLMAAANRLPPQYLYELSRRLWDTDKHAAMEWFAVGKARALYDAQRCVDATARQGIQVLPMLAPNVMTGIEADRKAYGEAGLRALARPDIFLDSESPAWICSHGMGAVMPGIQNKPMKESDWLRPSVEWEGIKNELRKELTQYFIEQGRPQDDPIPMTSEKFQRRTLPVSATSSYGWFDNRHIVLSNYDKNMKGPRLQRLTMLSDDGSSDEIATTSGMWCVGNGVTSYQTASEQLPDNRRHITLTIGSPGRWSSTTLDLYSPFINYGFGAQSFAMVWSAYKNATHQSPFDCRWETNATLSGLKNDRAWIPLLPGDGAIQFDAAIGTGSVAWVNGHGDAIPLVVDQSKISIGSFRYIAWKQAYFVAPTWSRLKQEGKSAPACIPASYIYPKENRVEEVCVPFDTNSTHNGVMFVPTKVGWLRAGEHRNTPHGLKPGGLYLTRAGGQTEKLVEVDINSWDVSPDGCKVAFGYREPGKFEETLEVLDLCLGS